LRFDFLRRHQELIVGCHSGPVSDLPADLAIMPFSFLAAMRELPGPPQLFLIFTAINVISWQCVAGQALVLFARAVEMPPSLVGVLLSFMPISMLLVFFVMPVVEWLGPRRLLLSTWLGRNAIAASVFLMPWAVGRFGTAAGWHVLLFATLGFSLIRAIGVGGWYPWLHEIVPKSQLGAYFSIETAMGHLINIFIAFGMAQVLALSGGIERFFWIYAFGIGAGLLSIFFISRIPGGAGLIGAPSHRYDPRPSLRKVWADREYRHFLLLAVSGLGSVMWLGSAVIMYLRDALGYGETRIMLLIALGGIGVASTIRFWGRAADRFGSVPTMIPLLASYALFAFIWLALFPGWRLTGWLIMPVLIFTTVFSAAYTMVTTRGMLCRVREEGRVGYTALWILSVSLANGVPPILAGLLIDTLGLTGFRLCFLIAGISGLITAGFMFGLSPEEGKPSIRTLPQLVRPSQPLRSLGQVFRITLGFGESIGDHAGAEAKRADPLEERP